jgi:hypothetical protein
LGSDEAELGARSSGSSHVVVDSIEVHVLAHLVAPPAVLVLVHCLCIAFLVQVQVVFVASH